MTLEGIFFYYLIFNHSLELFIQIMVELYPCHFKGMDKDQIIEYCHQLVEPLDDYIYSNFQDCTETLLDVMKDIITKQIDEDVDNNM